MTRHHVLVVGTGSVGLRHARNLHSVGCDVSCVDPREERLEQAATELSLKNQFTTLEVALQSA